MLKGLLLEVLVFKVPMLRALMFKVLMKRKTLSIGTVQNNQQSPYAKMLLMGWLGKVFLKPIEQESLGCLSSTIHFLSVVSPNKFKKCRSMKKSLEAAGI